MLTRDSRRDTRTAEDRRADSFDNWQEVKPKLVLGYKEYKAYGSPRPFLSTNTFTKIFKNGDGDGDEVMGEAAQGSETASEGPLIFIDFNSTYTHPCYLYPNSHSLLGQPASILHGRRRLEGNSTISPDECQEDGIPARQRNQLSFSVFR
jgi:hypothetical protein